MPGPNFFPAPGHQDYERFREVYPDNDVNDVEIIDESLCGDDGIYRHRRLVTEQKYKEKCSVCNNKTDSVLKCQYCGRFSCSCCIKGIYKKYENHGFIYTIACVDCFEEMKIPQYRKILLKMWGFFRRIIIR